MVLTLLPLSSIRQCCPTVWDFSMKKKNWKVLVHQHNLNLGITKDRSSQHSTLILQIKEAKHKRSGFTEAKQWVGRGLTNSHGFLPSTYSLFSRCSIRYTCVTLCGKGYLGKSTIHKCSPVEILNDFEGKLRSVIWRPAALQIGLQSIKDTKTGFQLFIDVCPYHNSQCLV